jgi:hypothetical protein
MKDQARRTDKTKEQEVFVELFVVADEVLMGQGVFGIFSTHDRALTYMEDFQTRTHFRCVIMKLAVTGNAAAPDKVCVAYVHDCIHDVFELDGLYGEPLLARDATGDKGLVVEFMIDAPDRKQIIQNL